MTLPNLTRRAALLGAAASLGGCSAISSLNAAATVLATYDLTPAPGSTAGARSGRTLVVARPQAGAAITTDRILIKPNPLSVTYLPDARWPDEAPAFLQTLLIRSIADTGRMGYVGPAEGGPVPDRALLTRMDAFQVEVRGEAFLVSVALSLTVLSDSDQRVIATRAFRQSAPVVDDSPLAIVAGFQAVMDALLPQMANFALAA